MSGDERKAWMGAGGEQYEEDQPEMRHVKIATTTGPRIAKPEHLDLKRPALRLLLPPKPSISRAGSVTIEKEWCGKLPADNWNVQPSCLELVPLDFPLERTHREIPDVDASTVACRISEILQKLSISAEYCDQTAKAKCKTEDFVSFRIRLYSGGEGGQPVVVEVQRRTGPVQSFMHTCRSILAAAEGQESKPKKGPKAMPSISSMKCLQGVVPKLDPEAECAKALTTIVELLHDKRIDTNVLGMENLCNLTDPMKTPLNTAELAAKAVVIGDEKFCLREEIYACLQRSSDHAMDAEEKGVDYGERLRTLSLKAFALSLNLTAQLNCLEGPVKDQSWFQDILLPMLLTEVENVNDSPTRATIAICCLNCLISTSMKSTVLSIRESIRNAEEIGNQRHELLATEAGRCLATLDS